LCGIGLASSAFGAAMGVQGALRSNGGQPVADGKYAVMFRLYASDTDPKEIWKELHESVTVSSGVFALHLGAVDAQSPLPADAFAKNPGLWLGMSVLPDGELPRVPLTWSPYAFAAASADSAAKAQLAYNLECAGCVDTAHLGFTYAASASKGGAAIDLECTGCVGTADIAAGAVTSTQIADYAVGSLQLAPKAVTADHLADGAVTSDKVAAGAVEALGFVPGPHFSGSYTDLKNIPDFANMAKVDADNTFTKGQTFGADITFTGGAQAQKLRLQVGASPPASCDSAAFGLVYYDTTRRGFFGCANQGWVRLSGVDARVYDSLDTTAMLDTTKTAGVTVTGGLVKLPSSLGSGDGADGSVTIAGTKNIHTDILQAGRAAPDGEAFPVSALGTATITLTGTGTGGTTAANANKTFAAGDDLVLINLQAPGATATNVGAYEVCEVASVSGAVITCGKSLTKTFGATDNTTLTGQKIVAQRVPNWSDVTVPAGTTLTATPFNGTLGGVLVFRASGTLKVDGLIDVSGRGLRGGQAVTGGWGGGWRGESMTTGFGTQRTHTADNGAGGGGDAEWCCAGSGAGGGGHGTAGAPGTPSGCSCGGGWAYGNVTSQGGGTIGAADLAKLLLGPGGGAGGVDGDNPDYGGGGGAGGGIVFVGAGTVQVGATGAIRSNGGAPATSNGETGGGGGGAGGSVLLTVGGGALGASLVAATGAAGGTASAAGGAGGAGRIAIRHVDAISGGTSPTAHDTTLPAAFGKSGVVQSTNLLASTGALMVSHLDRFVYTLSAKPANTEATVQFSQDGTSWVDSTGAAGKADTLQVGTKQVLNLGALGWTAGPFYYKVALTGDGTGTPVFEEAMLIYVAN